MNARDSIRRVTNLLILLTILTSLGASQYEAAAAEELPPYMDVITGSEKAAPPSAVQPNPAFAGGAAEPGGPAMDSVLTLNSAMLPVYESAHARYLANLRRQHPIIVALFNGAGGTMILYPPGRDPIIAPPVPIIYQLVKSVSHSSMTIFELLGPSLRHPEAETSWRDPMRTYRAKLQSALENIDKLPADISPHNRNLLADILRRNIALLDHCLAQGSFTYADLDSFARELRPDLLEAADIAGAAQVDHWTMVLKAWKEMLGKDWDETYAVVSSLYVTRRNNILFTLLAQQMGRQAIGDRLMLFETTDFRVTPDQMLAQLGHVVADRSLGMVFFGNYYFLGTEFMTAATRKEMLAQAARAKAEVMMPPLAPYRTHQWPWPTGNAYGEGPATIDSNSK
ncbi:MAG: hypothetical protein ACLQAT_22355 [Candidatus Binataceae bacterium]